MSTTTTTTTTITPRGNAAALEPSRDAYAIARSATDTLADLVSLTNTQRGDISEFFRLDYKFTYFATIAAILADADEEEAESRRAEHRHIADNFARRVTQVYNYVRDGFDEGARRAICDVRRIIVEVAQEEARLVANGILFPIFYRRELYSAFFYDFANVDDPFGGWDKLRDAAREGAEYYENVYPDICKTTPAERDALAREAAKAVAQVAPITD